MFFQRALCVSTNLSLQCISIVLNVSNNTLISSQTTPSTRDLTLLEMFRLLRFCWRADFA